jgi:hypothetical protein
MALGRDYDKACPIFNFSTRDAGVIFPFVLTDIASATTQIPFIDLDGSDLSVVLARFKLPMSMRLITVQAYACSDANGAKAAAASAEPIITLGYGTAPLGSGEAATTLAIITCDGAGAFGSVWSPGAGTTQVTLAAAQEIVAYLTTAAASATSGNQDGGARIVLWLAIANAPA